MTYGLAGNIEGKRFSAVLRPGANRLGRSSKDADLLVARDTVSRFHAQIVVTDAGVMIQDCHSHNGTFVNGARIDEAQIRPGDAIRLGDVELQLVEQGEGKDDGLAETSVEAEGRAAPTFRSHAQLDSAKLTWTETPSGRTTLDDASGLLQALVDLGSCLVRDEPGRDIGAVCLEHVARRFPFRLACLLELDQTSGQPEVRAHYPPMLEPELHVSRTMVDMVVRDRRTLLLQNVSPETPVLETAYKKGIRSAIVTPLMQDDQVLGVLYVDQDDPKRHFRPHDQKPLQYFANLVAAKIASVQTRNEIEWASFIQQQFLPEELPHPQGYEVVARLVPFRLVGGDLYDALKLPDGRYLYALGDVVGHGVGAALMMSNALATLRALAPVSASPLHLATHLHELMGAQLLPECYVTLFLGFLDPRSHRLDYVTAGHPPPLLLRPGAEGTFLDSTGPPIGMVIPVPLRSASIDMHPGSLLAIWSDGIPESTRLGVRPLQDFTQERLVALLRARRQERLQTILDHVFRESDEFLGNGWAQDDRTLLLLRRQPEATP